MRAALSVVVAGLIATSLAFAADVAPGGEGPHGIRAASAAGCTISDVIDWDDCEYRSPDITVQLSAPALVQNGQMRITANPTCDEEGTGCAVLDVVATGSGTPGGLGMLLGPTTPPSPPCPLQKESCYSLQRAPARDMTMRVNLQIKMQTPTRPAEGSYIPGSLTCNSATCGFRTVYEFSFPIPGDGRPMPVPDFTSTQKPGTREVTFTSTSTHQSYGPEQLRYQWDFGPAGGRDRVSSYTFPADGDYDVTLFVRDPTDVLQTCPGWTAASSPGSGCGRPAPGPTSSSWSCSTATPGRSAGSPVTSTRSRSRTRTARR